jgi:hypothetical protein
MGYRRMLLGFSICLWLVSSTNADSFIGCKIDTETNHRFPVSKMVVDVTKAPYFAKGDGKTDDTKALQQAIQDIMGLHKVLYFPKGTYLISSTLNWTNKNTNMQNAYGFNWFQGENASKTVIRLKDKTVTDPNKPASMMWCGGFGSADWFHNYIHDITFDVGEGNPGAIALQFYSNNTGAVRNCRFIGKEGMVGLDLGHRDMNGPLLIKNCEVLGFRRGVSASGAVNSMTFEKLTLKNQTDVGFENAGQAIAIRSVLSENSVPAFRLYGSVSLMNAELRGQGNASNVPAILNYNGGRIWLRDITTSGYSRALADVQTPDLAAAFRIQGADKPGSVGPNISEYASHPITNLFTPHNLSLRLEVAETPETPWDDPKQWAVVDQFGADPTGQKDSSAAVQKAIDSGATTIFFPGNYALEKTIIIRGKARRILGTGAWTDYNGKAKPDFIIKDGVAKIVFIEHFAPIGGGIEIKTDRTVVIRSIQGNIINHGKGNLFIEDVSSDAIQINPNQQVWARQLNVENEGTHVANDGGKLWVLGYKTERGGTLLHTKNTGRSEIFGTFSYTTTVGKLAPMFINEDASVFAFFSEVCYTGDPFTILIRERRKGKTKEIKRGEAGIWPYIGVPGTK